MQNTDRTRSLLIAIAAVGLTVSIGLGVHIAGAVSPVRAKDASVAIIDFAFDPDRVTIAANSVVTWTNTSSRDHTVTSDAGGTLDSGPIGQGEAYGNLFDTPGTYSYHCAIHPTMKGTIVVTAAAATAVPSGSPAPTPPAGTLPPGFVSARPSLEPSAIPAQIATASPGVSGDATGSTSGPLLAFLVVAVVAIGLVGGLIAVRRRRAPSA